MQRTGSPRSHGAAPWASYTPPFLKRGSVDRTGRYADLPVGVVVVHVGHAGDALLPTPAPVLDVVGVEADLVLKGKPEGPVAIGGRRRKRRPGG